ncbi:MAG: spore cortex biosynthesis protein YabQ [Clostridia bacterium]|nr:spore cortex biosynthesis protein YabQ [Clostridia bacterium]
MVWEIHPAVQVFTFLWSLVLGVLLCVWYDFFRLIRRHFHCNAWRVGLQDLLFWSVSAVATFFFLLARENGRVRLFVLLGALFGFGLWRVTAGAVLLEIFSRVLSFWQRIFHLIFRLFGRILHPLVPIFRKVGNFFKKIPKIFVFRRKNS